nr:MAG TPA: TRAFFICKING PROTEIN PARTICLE COMPLEX SUBUNIT APPARATUS, VESICLE TRANSPORT, ER-GOLGI [Caudoviricetes sp.]
MLIEFKRKMGYRIGAKLLRATANFFYVSDYA